MQSVDTTTNWFMRAPGAGDRIEARLSGAAFAPHRHDTYAIGITLAGVQTFDYRGATRHSLPSQIVVLHPDEVHDGRAGTADAFHYRTLYLRPALLQTMIGGQSLPFVDGGISTDVALKQALLPLLDEFDRVLSDLEYHDALVAVADALTAIARTPRRKSARNYAAAQKARAYLDAHRGAEVTLAELEAAAGFDRWQLSRDFRAIFGTSPYRYLTLRRLDQAQAMMIAGESLADVAAACAFSDQSHLTRQFRKAFGLTPKAWLLKMRPQDVTRSFYKAARLSS